VHIDIRKTKKLIVPKVYEFRRSWKMLAWENKY
jgi:hypothetical protein